jgi:hypothetical protein
MLEYLPYTFIRFELLFGGEYAALIIFVQCQSIKFHTLLKFPYYHVLKSPLYYHGPLIKFQARVSE